METRSKKQWRIVSKEGVRLEFYPIFEVVNDEKTGLPTNQVEARYLEMEFDDNGKNKKFTFDWLNMYMFIYFTANEELRRNLALKYERKLNYIPFDVTFKLSESEKVGGIAKRRIELPVDELTMAIARDDAFRMLLGKMRNGHVPNPKDFIYKGRKG